MSNGTVLTEIINSISGTVTDLTSQIANIDSQIASLEEQQDALNYLLDTAQAEHTARILATSGVIRGVANAAYGISNLTDYVAYQAGAAISPAARYGDYSMARLGDYEGDIGKKIWIWDEDTQAYEYEIYTVTNAVYDDVSITTYTVDNVLPANFDHGIYLEVLTINDSYLTDRENSFVKAYAHLATPLGTGGTYGIDDMIAKMTTAKGVLQSNKDFYNSIGTFYDVWAA